MLLSKDLELFVEDITKNPYSAIKEILGENIYISNIEYGVIKNDKQHIRVYYELIESNSDGFIIQPGYCGNTWRVYIKKGYRNSKEDRYKFALEINGDIYSLDEFMLKEDHTGVCELSEAGTLVTIMNPMTVFDSRYIKNGHIFPTVEKLYTNKQESKKKYRKSEYLESFKTYISKYIPKYAKNKPVFIDGNIQDVKENFLYIGDWKYIRPFLEKTRKGIVFGNDVRLIGMVGFIPDSKIEFNSFEEIDSIIEQDETVFRNWEEFSIL